MSDWDMARLTDSIENDESFDSTASSDIHIRDKPRADGRRRVARHNDGGPTSLDTGRASSRSSFVHVSSSVSTRSTGSDVLSCPSSTFSTWSSTPNFSAPEARDRPHDAILHSFASRTPPTTPAATSPPRQISRPSSISSESTSEADEGTSYSEESRSEQPTSRTPASTASLVDNVHPIDLDQEVAHRIEVIPLQLALHDLGLHDRYLFLHDVNSDHTEVPADINSFDIELDENPHHQATPWTAVPRDDGQPFLEGSILAPFTGLAHTEFHSRARVHRQSHKRIKHHKSKAINTNNKVETTPLGEGACIGNDGYGQSSSSNILALKSGKRNLQDRPTDECHDSIFDLLQHTAQHSSLWHSVGCSILSVEALGNVFFPGFALSHLTRDSLDHFGSELVAPNTLRSDVEHLIAVSLGFGPPINYNVCTFESRSKSSLQSYRKLPGLDGLHVEQSLPIVIDWFVPEAEASGLDAWLDRVINSETHLEAYLELMQRKKNGSSSVQILICLVKWYKSSKYNPLKQENGVSRDALKLLMTTTLLTSVPKLSDIPESLREHLSPRPVPSNIKLSPIAPKLLSRQIKVSIHHLQRDLVHALFCYLRCELELATEVRVAIALLIAFVLELVEKAGREFARFASTINHTVHVKEEDVIKYESNVKTQVFDRVRKSVFGTAGHLGQLGNELEGLGSITEGKGADTGNGECQYVQSILKTVL